MDIEIKFEPENLNGLVAPGTYLMDAAKRLGANLGAECDRSGATDGCAVEIKAGGELLSEVTAAERATLGTARLGQGQRLACQARIEKSGAVVAKILDAKASVAEKEVADAKEFRKEFGKMPLADKVLTLMEFEASTLSEAMNNVFNAPTWFGDKVMDFLANKGRTLDAMEREQRRPVEHRQTVNPTQGNPPAEESVSTAATAAVADCAPLPETPDAPTMGTIKPDAF